MRSVFFNSIGVQKNQTSRKWTIRLALSVFLYRKVYDSVTVATTTDTYIENNTEPFILTDAFQPLCE